MIGKKDIIHKHILGNLNKVEQWFEQKHSGLYMPFYSSYDIRDAGYKVVNVDANIYPAGFNNICELDRDHAPELAKSYIKTHYAFGVKKILLLTEEHTNNPFYWENVRAIRQIIEDAGYEVKVAMPSLRVTEPFEAQTILGNKVWVDMAIYRDGRIQIEDFTPDIIISNNDFSVSYLDWAKDIETPMTPPRELGWYQRKKSRYFEAYNTLATEFAELIEIDPWYLTVATETLADFDVSDEASRALMAEKVQQMIDLTQKKYNEYGIEENPFVYIKNNSGTYGLGVIQVNSAEEAHQLNYKMKKKMKAAKGGREVNEVIIQEGVPSIVRGNDNGTSSVTAEPAIYMIGCRLAGGFLRSHKEKNEKESLNSPGAAYLRLCTSDLNINVEGKPLENVYGWVANLGLLAIGRETAHMGVKYIGYQLKNCGE